MAVFRIERTRDYTVMSNHHLRNANLSLKAKGLLSMMLSLPEDGYQAALQSQQRREIKIKRYARVIEGHILDFKPGKRRRS